MHIKLWGTRGSVPTPVQTTSRYGGNTSCVSVRAPDGELFILDAGIGLHWLGCDLLSNGFAQGGSAHILISHLHWDHIQGLPFFVPLLISGCRIHLYGSGGDRDLSQLLQSQMERAYCPVPDFFEDGVGARLSITSIDETPFSIGSTTITPRRVNHVGGSATFGFRLASRQRSMAYIPDVEYLEDSHREPSLALADGVDLLIHDAHHTAAEYETRRGFGHCSDEDAVGLARDAGVGKILLFHHHPDHDDDAIDEIVRSHSGGEISVEGAAEHNEYTLDSC